MATFDHIVYHPKRAGDPFLVVCLHRTRTRASVAETYLASTRAEAERIREERERELCELVGIEIVEPVKLGKRSVSKRGKRILTPRTEQP